MEHALGVERPLNSLWALVFVTSTCRWARCRKERVHSATKQEMLDSGKMALPLSGCMFLGRKAVCASVSSSVKQRKPHKVIVKV